MHSLLCSDAFVPDFGQKAMSEECNDGGKARSDDDHAPPNSHQKRPLGMI